MGETSWGRNAQGAKRPEGETFWWRNVQGTKRPGGETTSEWGETSKGRNLLLPMNSDKTEFFWLGSSGQLYYRQILEILQFITGSQPVVFAQFAIAIEPFVLR